MTDRDLTLLTGPINGVVADLLVDEHDAAVRWHGTHATVHLPSHGRPPAEAAEAATAVLHAHGVEVHGALAG